MALRLLDFFPLGPVFSAETWLPSGIAASRESASDKKFRSPAFRLAVVISAWSGSRFSSLRFGRKAWLLNCG